ncbi:MAG: TMEM175 family protein [Pseudomonadota bacterium]
MEKDRLLAFSDGVIAIIITIMALELKAPQNVSLTGLYAIIPGLSSYVLSFIYIAIYWNNHHHMFHIVKHVNGSILWANNYLLFWLSLVPFATAFMGNTGFASLPTAIYGCILLMSAMAYFILQGKIIKAQGEESLLKKALGKDRKGKVSASLYVLAIIISIFSPLLANIIYSAVAVIWLVPDKRIENILKN